MRNIKFSRRSLLRGLGYGTVLCTGLTKTLYAQVDGRIMRLAMFGYANGSHPDSAPTRQRARLRAEAAHGAAGAGARPTSSSFSGMTLERGSGNSHKSTSFSIFGLGAHHQHRPGHRRPRQGHHPAGVAGVLDRHHHRRRRGHPRPVAAQRQLPARPAHPGGRLPAHRRAGHRRRAARPPGTPAHDHAPGRRAGAAAAQDPARLREGRTSTPTAAGWAPTEKAKFDFYTESLRTLERDIGSGVTGPGRRAHQADRLLHEDPGPERHVQRQHQGQRHAGAEQAVPRHHRHGVRLQRHPGGLGHVGWRSVGRAGAVRRTSTWATGTRRRTTTPRAAAASR